MNKLLEALNKNDETLAVELINNGENVMQRDPTGVTPLHLASKLGMVKATKLLLEKGAEVDALNMDGVSPLHLTAAREKPETFAILLAHGADPRKVERDGWTPLHWAGFRGCVPVIEQLL